MTDYMGSEPRELPLGTPPPVITPPEGVIISRVEGDGWTRKYLYQSKRTMGDRIVENSLLIAEIPPQPRSQVYRDVPIQTTPVVVLPQNPAPQAPAPQAAPPPAPAPSGQGMPVPGIAGAMRVPGRAVSSPFAGVAGAEASLPPRPQLAGPGTNLPILSSPTPPRSLRLAQGPGSQTPAQVPPSCPVPPGPMQLPDGKIIQLEDSITLSELWQILPYMTQQCVQEAQKQQPPPPPPSQLPGVIPTSPIGAGFPGFGPASGAFGQGGFIGQGGGGGGAGLFGPLGAVVQGNPQPPPPLGGGGGAAGPPGPPGPPGAGAAIEFLTKTDGDFTAGPGAFVPVPGTLLSFTQGTDGSVIFLINACFGCGFNLATNNALGIMVDGVIFPLQANLWHTFVAGVGGFLNGASAVWPMVVTAGSHSVQIMLRGIAAGEFCDAAGLGMSATISANPQVPLALSVLHQGLGTQPSGAPVFVVDGTSKTDGNFAAVGALTAVPTTQVAFNVNTQGNVQVIVSADFAAAPFDSLPSVSLGVIVDGGVPQLLATFSEEIGAGSDKLFTLHLTGMIVLPNLPVGPHSVQMAYSSGPGAPSPMVLVASPALPATVSVVHS